MNLIKITEVTERFDISSRTLRYYEQVGLLQCVRPPLEKYRFYDEENISRLQQIIVLRKMQIPIKDIISIYDSKDMSVLVQSFVNRMEAIKNEISTLSELKSYLNDFLNAMMKYGITQISALPLLYERVEAEFLRTEVQETFTMQRLSELSDKLAKPIDIDIVELPPMRVVSSVLTDTQVSDIEGFWDWLSHEQIPFGKPGGRTLFEYQNGDEIVFMQRLDVTIENSAFICYNFDGGLFAVCSAFCDENIGALQNRMIQSFDDNVSFEVDFLHNGNLRHSTLIETIYSPDSKREKINLYLPIKRRKLDFGDFEEFEQVQNITAGEILQENPVLREYRVNLHKITTIYDPHYVVLDSGEAEFVAWISARMLNTNVAVKIPFRIDVEFFAEKKSEEYLWGTTEGCLWFSHGNCSYRINAENNSEEALSKHGIVFQQPILGNSYLFPKIGDIPHDVYNKLTWIIGEKHFAVIINDEVRFCGVKFPYMDMDMYLQTPQPILIGTDGQGKKLIRSISISQLKNTPKTSIKQGAMRMTVKQSNNMLPNSRRMITSHYGENYWFNGCAGYLMECLGEMEYDYLFFAGLTGESFTQIYSKNHFRGSGVMDYRLSEKGNYHVVEEVFEKCGYASSFVPLTQILSNKEMYLQTLISYIDKGVPVILNDYGKNPHSRYGFGVLVGYENFGKTLLYMVGDNTEPDRISMKDLLTNDYKNETGHCHGWLFIGEKKQNVPLAKLYKERILSLTELLKYENENYCFGTKAFRAWADGIENGRFVSVKPEEFDDWSMYTVYICNLATNSGGCKGFMERALDLNPELVFISELIQLYQQTGHFWNDDNGNDLEALGGGFNITLEALQNPEKYSRIVAVIRKFESCMDKVVDIIQNSNI